MDLAVIYQDRTGVIYRDKWGARFEADAAGCAAPRRRKSVEAFDINNDSWTDLAVGTASGIVLLMNRNGKLKNIIARSGDKPFLFADLANRAIGDMVAGRRGVSQRRSGASGRSQSIRPIGRRGACRRRISITTAATIWQRSQ